MGFLNLQNSQPRPQIKATYDQMKLGKKLDAMELMAKQATSKEDSYVQINSKIQFSF